MSAQLVLFTDFGWQDPYVGQVKSVLLDMAPGVPVIDLLHNVPDYNAHAGAHLLSALYSAFPTGAVFVCVVDPGVGGPREAVAVEADGRWFVGPDNGLLSVIVARSRHCRVWRITGLPGPISPSFHGRDLFAPVAGRIAAGNFPADWLEASEGLQVSFEASDLPRIIYIDHYGNAWTGIRGGLADVPSMSCQVNGHSVPWRRVFAEARKGEAFWYVNSAGLVEIAVNRGAASQLLGLRVGDPVRLSAAPESRLH